MVFLDQSVFIYRNVFTANRYAFAFQRRLLSSYRIIEIVQRSDLPSLRYSSGLKKHSNDFSRSKFMLWKQWVPRENLLTLRNLSQRKRSELIAMYNSALAAEYALNKLHGIEYPLGEFINVESKPFKKFVCFLLQEIVLISLNDIKIFFEINRMRICDFIYWMPFSICGLGVSFSRNECCSSLRIVAKCIEDSSMKFRKPTIRFLKTRGKWTTLITKKRDVYSRNGNLHLSPRRTGI